MKTIKSLRASLTVWNAWVNAHRKLGIEPSYAQLFHIFECYGEKSRSYHTIIHVAQCLTFLREHFPDEPDSVILPVVIALIYHDVIYDSKMTDNEDASARVASIYMKVQSFPDDFVQNVVRLILLTKSHTVEPGDRMASIMIDTDMNVLAWGERDYLRYASQVWKEYSHFGRGPYIAGRMKFLMGLDPDKVFTTPEVNIEQMISNVAWNRHLELELLRDNPAEIMGA